MRAMLAVRTVSMRTSTAAAAAAHYSILRIEYRGEKRFIRQTIGLQICLNELNRNSLESVSQKKGSWRNRDGEVADSDPGDVALQEDISRIQCDASIILVKPVWMGNRNSKLFNTIINKHNLQQELRIVKIAMLVLPSV
jgi:hypothetical protein